MFIILLLIKRYLYDGYVVNLTEDLIVLKFIYEHDYSMRSLQLRKKVVILL
jgi:hypothetical protein